MSFFCKWINKNRIMIETSDAISHSPMTDKRRTKVF